MILRMSPVCAILLVALSLAGILDKAMMLKTSPIHEASGMKNPSIPQILPLEAREDASLELGELY